MAERHGDLDADLNRMLEDLAAHLAVPDGVSLAGTVRARLETERGHTGHRSPAPLSRYRIRTIAFALVLTLVIIFSAVLTFSPATRHAVADWLGLRGVRIEQDNNPLPSPLGASLSLGDRVTLNQARQRTDFHLLTPRSRFGPPDEVYVAETAHGNRATLLYTPRAGLPATADINVGLLVTEFRAEILDDVVRKRFGGGTQLEQVTVNGGTGYWLSGELHALTFADRNGRFFDDESRLAGNTLIWEQGPLTIRVESALSKEEAIRVAETLAPHP